MKLMIRRPGFTLAECVTAIFLMTILLTGIASFFRQAVTWTYCLAGQVYLEHSAEAALTMIADEISQGKVETLYIKSSRNWLSINRPDHTVSFSMNDAGAICRDIYDGTGRQPITDEQIILVQQLEFSQDSNESRLIHVKISLLHKKYRITISKSLSVFLMGQGSL